MNEPRPYAPLEAHEIELDQDDEFYWRQCHPGYLDGGVPSVQMFCESTGDNGKISGARSTKASAQLAYEERLSRGGQTAGSWGVTVSEIAEAGTRAVDDSAGDDALPTGHTYIDYRHLEMKPSLRAVRSRLHEAALSRPRQWPTA
ncbi:hypothetical protein [Cellulomonas sp. KH9]|uniref:hypothetical protein n=1 Tax=Cellulomonas sp. KH9 TaxID=1855324 RepID=UPI0008DF97FE|nr:hypothetical protein [Cellulomonas sp. KH9]SFK12407.1 hypothetical protein SAMN05216467_2054 [Cellulomonas sp. KH9]